MQILKIYQERVIHQNVGICIVISTCGGLMSNDKLPRNLGVFFLSGPPLEVSFLLAVLTFSADVRVPSPKIFSAVIEKGLWPNPTLPPPQGSGQKLHVVAGYPPISSKVWACRGALLMEGSNCPSFEGIRQSR